MQNNRSKMIREMLDKNPDDSFLNYAVALEFKKNGQFEEAIRMLESLVDRDKNYLAAYYQLGKLYEHMGQMEEAIVSFKQGIDIAEQQNDLKTLSELREAVLMLDDEQ